jgi:hypothetical protein
MTYLPKPFGLENRPHTRYAFNPLQQATGNLEGKGYFHVYVLNRWSPRNRGNYKLIENHTDFVATADSGTGW